MKQEECPNCGEMGETPVCRECGTKVRALTAEEQARVGDIPTPNLVRMQANARLVTYATPGDRLEIVQGTA